jgi:hypothetical protein
MKTTITTNTVPARTSSGRGRAQAAAWSLGAMLLASTAVADLERTGPVDPKNGYPAWYQDTSGLALEFGAPLNQSELEGGWLLLLPPDVPALPEVLGVNFFDEHFYWAGNAAVDYTLPDNSRSSALLVLALEAAFGGGAAVPGDQMVFARIRIVLRSLPHDGDYTVYTPYGVYHFPDQVAGERLFFTEDVGLTPGDFEQALVSRLGPFLLPSVVSGGAEMPALTASNPTPDTDPDHFGGAFTPTPYPGTGKSYIADPARIGPVTGSLLPPFVSPVDGLERDHNIFRVEGPAGFVIETTNFALAGRIFTGAIAGRVTVTRATYSDPGAGANPWVDVFATAEPTTAGRLPGQPKPAATLPVLSFYPAPPPFDPVTLESLQPLSAPAGIAAVQMFNTGTHFWGQIPVAEIPRAVTVVNHNARNTAGQVAEAFFERKVTDAVTVTAANYNAGALTVSAVSSDVFSSPALTLGGFGDLSGGSITVSSLLAPPARVTVFSTAGGLCELPVTMAPGSPIGAGALIAANDSFTFPEDSGARNLDVLSNDSGYTGTPTVTIVSPPGLGAAAVNADGTITYTPNPNANGSDALLYSFSDGVAESNLGFVQLIITPENDAPVANPDAANGVAGVAIPINVLGNDTDPDGAADLVLAASVSAVTRVSGTGAGSILGVAGGVVTFSATAGGVYTFSYRAQDAAGVQSLLAATVTVTVIGTETITVTRSQYTSSSRRWRVDGTDSLRQGQTIQITYANGTMRNPRLVNGVLTTDATGYVVGTATVDAAGVWAFDRTLASALGIDNPTNSGNNTPTGGFWTSPPRNLRMISTLTGATVTSNLTIR